jgi:hypothetical protein
MCCVTTDNRIGDEGAKALSEVLPRTKITSLNLVGEYAHHRPGNRNYFSNIAIIKPTKTNEKKGCKESYFRFAVSGGKNDLRPFLMGAETETENCEITLVTAHQPHRTTGLRLDSVPVS